MSCKYGDTACGVYWDCGKCERDYRAAACRRLTPAQRAYDQMVDPLHAYSHGTGCSCHINPPCGYCTSQSEDPTP